MKATDIEIVVDEENPEKNAPELSEEKPEPKKDQPESADPEKATGNSWLLSGGIVGGVIMAIGLGVLTSMVVKGKNANNSLAEENGELNAQLAAL